MSKHVGFSERDPLETRIDYTYGTDGQDDDDDASTEAFYGLKQESFNSDRDRSEAMAAERLSMRLLSIPDDDDEAEDRILRESLAFVTFSPAELEAQQRKSMRLQQQAGGRFKTMVIMLVVALVLLAIGFYVGAKVIGPPSQPLGPYQLVERQVCMYVFVVL